MALESHCRSAPPQIVPDPPKEMASNSLIRQDGEQRRNESHFEGSLQNYENGHRFFFFFLVTIGMRVDTQSRVPLPRRNAKR